MNNNQSLSFVSSCVDWKRSFLADQAHQFLRLEMDNGAQTPSSRDDLLLERCVSHLMAVSNCSQRTATTQAAQAIAELASRHSRVSFDMDRSTSHALFVTDRASDITRVISAAELLQLLQAHETELAAAKAAHH